jgi:hypothetical protein
MFKKGQGGRNKGSKNRLTISVKDSVLRVFNLLQEDDGEHSLLEFAKKHPRDFYIIASKLIPHEVNQSAHITGAISIVFTPAEGCDPINFNNESSYPTPEQLN